MRPDRYSCFRDLSSSESSQAYRIQYEDRASSVAVIAPHAGRIEVGTSEIARAVADCALSFYLFEGLKSSANADLHITSSRFDEPIALSLAEASRMVLTVHGQAGSESFVNVGGAHQAFCEVLMEVLSDAGFLASSSQISALQGLDPKNICNRGTLGMGVQLELSRGLRTQLLSDSKSLRLFADTVRKACDLQGL